MEMFREPVIEAKSVEIIIRGDQPNSPATRYLYSQGIQERRSYPLLSSSITSDAAKSQSNPLHLVAQESDSDASVESDDSRHLKHVE